MSILTMLAQHADIAAHHISVAGSMVSDAALHGKQA
ncbi:MAG: PTS beta-glucoside transporter subunit IIABC, partial [Phyllobacterium sp.]